VISIFYKNGLVGKVGQTCGIHGTSVLLNLRNFCQCRPQE